MYIIIGGDGKEYGPVTTDQVRAWLAAGRANLATQAKFEGTAEWKPLGEYPDFGGTAEEPPLVAAEESQPAPAGPLDISSCFERSWTLLKQKFWPLASTTLIVMVALYGLSRIPMIGFVGTLLLGGVFYGGLFYFVLETIRGRPATLATAFSGFGRAFLPLVLARVLTLVLCTLGICALIIPGIYLLVAYAFTYLLIIDRGLGVWQAMETSRRIITAQWWRFLGLLLLSALFLLLGLALLFVGIFVTMPLVVGAIAYAYEDMSRS